MFPLSVGVLLLRIGSMPTGTVCEQVVHRGVQYAFGYNLV